MAGIKLTTGETIGAWSLDQHDGQVESFDDDGEDPLRRALPSAGAAAASSDGGGAAAEDDADDFAKRMMEKLYYQRLKAKQKLEAAAAKEMTRRSRRSARKDPDLAGANPWAHVHELQASLAALRDGGSALHSESGEGRRTTRTERASSERSTVPRASSGSYPLRLSLWGSGNLRARASRR